MTNVPGQHRHGAGACGVLLLAHDHPQFAVEHEEGLVLLVVDVHRAAVAAPVEVLGQRERPAGLLAAEPHLGQGAQEPDGRLGVRAGDHAAGYGPNELGNTWAPSVLAGPGWAPRPGLANRRRSIMSKAILAMIDNLCAWMSMPGCGGPSPRWPRSFTTAGRRSACTSPSPRWRGRSATWNGRW